jgi:hypothetical protein
MSVAKVGRGGMRRQKKYRRVSELLLDMVFYSLRRRRSDDRTLLGDR